MSLNISKDAVPKHELVKGQRMSLEKTSPGLEKAMLGLGWDICAEDSKKFDLDAQVFVIKKSKENEVVFYHNLENLKRTIAHQGDNRTGEGEGDDEKIVFDLKALMADDDVEELVVTATIYDAINLSLNFGQVDNAYVRLINVDTEEVLCKYDLSEDYSTSVSIIVCRLYKHNGEWKFEATGKGETVELGGLFAKYGINAD